MVEHRIEPWLDAVDRLVVLGADGVIVADGPPRAVLAEQGPALARAGVWVPGLRACRSRWRSTPAWPHRCTPGTGAVISAYDVEVDLTRRSSGSRRLRRTALAPVDAELRAGRGLAISGPSGAGKSTLLTVLAGLRRPTRGRVTAAAELAHKSRVEPWRWPSRVLADRVSWSPQTPETGLVTTRVRDELVATGQAVGRDRAWLDARVDGLLDALRLGHLADASPYHLSGGEQRRLMVAAALAHGPVAATFDEPTVGQDRNTWAAVVGALGSARAAGSALGVATHDETAMLALGDDTCTLDTDRGRAMRAAVGPLSRLAACLLPVVGALAVRDVRTGLIVVAMQLVLLGWLCTDWRSALGRLAFGAIASTSIVISTWLYGGRDLDEALGAGLRVLSIVLPAALLTATIDPSRLGDHLAQRLRLPARVVVAATSALQRLDDTVETWRTIQLARRARGLGLDGGPVRRVRASAAGAFALLVVSLRRATVTTIAMDARGFATATRRTWAEPAPWTTADSAVLAASLALAVLPWTLR